MATYYVTDLFNSIIRNEADSGDLASQNADVADHATTTNFILCGQCGISNSGACNRAIAATAVKLQFNKDGGGTWTDVGAASEIAYANVSGLTNDSTAGTARCSSTPTGCTGAVSVKDCEDGAVTTTSVAAEYWHELKFGLSPANAVAGVKYAFRLYDVTNSLVINGTNANWQAEITIASAGSTYQDTATDGVKGADTTARIVTVGKTSTDGAKASDAASVTAQLVAAIADAFDVSDVPSSLLFGLVYLIASDYIASGATDATTAQLTAPDGKTSGADFQAGRISDDTNPLPAIDLAADKYTELEWCLHLSSALTEGDEIEFRVTASGREIDTYTQTAKITISAGAIQLTVTDGFGMAETLARISTFRNTITDGFSGAENQARIATLPAASTDTAAFSETLARGMMLSNVATDGVKLAEVLQNVLSISATATDAANISDTAARIIQAVAATSDGLTATDSVAAMLVALCQSTDGIVVAESLATALSSQANATDAVKIADAAARGMNIIGAATDALKISESLARILTARVSATDGTKISEPLSPQTAYASSLTVDIGSVESGALSDTYAVDTAYLKLNETSGAPPCMDYTFNFTGIRGTPETVVFRGRYTGNAGHQVWMQAWDNTGSDWVDLVRIVHSATADSTYTESILDPKFVASEIVKIRFYHPTAGADTHDLYVDQIYILYNFGVDAMLTARPTSTDAFAVAESIAGSLSMSVTASDAFVLSEALAGAISALLTASDGIALSDAAEQALSTAIQGIVADGFTAAEIAAASVQMSQSVTDGMSLAEILSVAASMQGSATDGARVAEVVARVITAAMVATDGFKVADSGIGSASISVTVTDGAVLSDTTARQTTISGTAADGVSLSDLLAVAALFSPAITDGVKFAELLAADLGGLFDEIVSDGLRGSDSAASTAQFIRTLSDQFNLSESLSAIITTALAITDGAVLSDSVARILTAQRSASDAIVLTDATAGELAAAIYQAIAADGLLLSDSAQSIAQFDLTVSDSAKFSETISTVMQFLAAIADGFNLTDATAEGEEFIPRGRVHIDFSSRAASIVFTSINGGKIIFTVRRPEIDFTAN